jgi:hypothetical protein
MLSNLLVHDLGDKQHPKLSTAPSEALKETLLFKSQVAQQNSTNYINESGTQARLDWGKEVEAEINLRLLKCQFAFDSLDPEPTGFLFSPTFRLSSNDGVRSELYIGSFNWMSDPKVSANIFLENISKGKISPLKCEISPPR